MIDILLYDFLNELIFIKDAESLILLPKTINITKLNNVYLLDSIFNGENIDNTKHKLNVDVKAVTMHNLSANKTENGWEAVFILDLLIELFIFNCLTNCMILYYHKVIMK